MPTGQLQPDRFHLLLAGGVDIGTFLQTFWSGGMGVYVVTWNLNRERSNYDQARRDFVSHLEKLDNKADPGLESTRFVSTTSTPDQLDLYLRQKMDGNDRLFLTILSRGGHQGWLKQDVWDWINARL
jgi:hypothetical protein